MRFRILLGALLVAALFTSGSQATATPGNVAGDRQWTVVNFMNAVQVYGAFVMGPVLIVHDDAKMARGEACTTFYRFDPSRGPQEELVSFHCVPVKRAVVETTTFTLGKTDPSGCKRLIAYQIGGDSELHAIPQN